MKNFDFQKLWQEIEVLNASLKSLRPLDENLNTVLQEKLRVEWTYNSNAIEGNTLTFGETLFFLREGLTSEGRPLKDFLEAKNHAEAIDVLSNFIQDKKPITEFFIKSLHGVLMKGINSTLARERNGQYVKKKLHIGEYKKQPNHILLASGKLHHYCDPVQVPGEMEILIKWLYSEETKKLSSVEKSALLHLKFVTIHPFDDGNGRISRLLMNLVLMQEGFPPCIVKNKNRKEYINCLEKVRKTKDKTHFLIFIAQELKESMIFMKNVLSKKEVLVDPFHSLNKKQRQDIVLKTIEEDPFSISQIQEKIPSVKLSTLKKDLKELVDLGKIQKSGKLKSVLYFKEPLI